MIRHAVFDLETVRDESVPFHPKPKMKGFIHEYMGLPVKAWEVVLNDPNPFPPPPCHQVACIGYALFENYEAKVLKTVGGTTEREQLTAFLGYLEQLHPTLVSWNGRGFDVPVLTFRALKYGIVAPWFTGRGVRYRYGDDGHIDLMDSLSDYGAAPRTPMEQVARLIGLPGKPEGTDGSRVEDMMKEEGGLERVSAYCLTDVLQESIIFLRRQLLANYLSLSDFKKSIESLRELVHRTEGPWLPNFLTHIDWKELALETHVAEVMT